MNKNEPKKIPLTDGTKRTEPKKIPLPPMIKHQFDIVDAVEQDILENFGKTDEDNQQGN